MANMMDYLDWRGDLTFAVSEFNEVDNLLLAQLVYVDFAGIVPAPEEGGDISLREASKRFWQLHDEEEILALVSMTKSAPFVMKKMAESARFGDARLSKYLNDISDEEQSQFSVMCVRLSDGSLFVTYSGTDNTIVGWRENFNMGYLEATPGQLKSVRYLNRVAQEEPGIIRVGGHSKGGNLSVYAAVHCEPEIQERIETVYSNDGPGFRADVLESEAYKRMMPKIKSILPESSIVGMLLIHQQSYEVVRSSESGVQQHDAMSWEVLGTSFVYVEEVAAQSILLDETVKAWLGQLDMEQRHQIVESAFSMLEEAGIHTVDDFYHSRWDTIQKLMKAKSELAPETQKLFSQAIRLLWKTGNEMVRKNVKHAVQERRVPGKPEI